MKTLPLTQGKVTLVDDDVYEWAKDFNWCACKMGHRFCVVRNIRALNGKKVLSYLHREIMKPDKGLDIHHIDGDSCNNQRKNLTITTRSQNLQGFQRPKKGKTSKFRGVRKRSDCQIWEARVWLASKQVYSAHFKSEEEAARAYDRAAWKFFGKFAQFNFPRPWLKIKP